jgi:hypothetical protein
MGASGANGSTGTGSGSGAGASGSRSLPAGVEGLVLIGRLRFAGINDRNGKQINLDVEVVNSFGRIEVMPLSAWIADNDGAMTPMGQLMASGGLVALTTQPVALVVSCRATDKGRLYWTAEGLVPLEVPAPTTV